MIRSALIALGFCAGAASAQAALLASPTLDMRGDTEVVLAADDQAGIADVQADDLADSQNDTAVLPNGDNLDAGYFTAFVAGCLPRSQDVLLPADLNVVPAPAADGSDPSADFCP